MILRKITVDNSVRYVPKSEKPKEKKRLNQKQQKLVHSLVNKTKNCHKTIKKGLLVDLDYLQNTVSTFIKISKIG